MLKYKSAIVLLIGLSVAACTWVETTPQGEKVRVLSRPEVVHCKKLGETHTMLKDKVGGIPRNREKVKQEMEALARNSAADMGGDTVVPVTEIRDGKQVFEVYRCINP
jgi:hypothetical protein